MADFLVGVNVTTIPCFRKSDGILLSAVGADERNSSTSCNESRREAAFLEQCENTHDRDHESYSLS